MSYTTQYGGAYGQYPYHYPYQPYPQYPYYPTPYYSPYSLFWYLYPYLGPWHSPYHYGGGGYQHGGHRVDEALYFTPAVATEPAYTPASTEGSYDAYGSVDWSNPSFS